MIVSVIGSVYWFPPRLGGEGRISEFIHSPQIATLRICPNMILAVQMLLANVLAQQAMPAMPLSPVTDESVNNLHGNCQYESASGTDTASKVRDVVRRFNAAIICKDGTIAALFVDEGGAVAEIEERTGDDGEPSKWVRSGPWPEQLFLFTRPDSEPSTEQQGRLVQGNPTVIIDGSSAFVRQPLWTEIVGSPPVNDCLIEHLMLVKVGLDWKIRHMMLVHDAESCEIPQPKP